MRAVNLIPADQRSGQSVGAGRSGGAAYAVIALVAGLAVMALLYGISRHDISTSQAEVASLQARAAQAQSAASRLAPYTNFVAMREARTQAVAQLVDSRFDWSHAMQEFGRVLPITASLTSLDGTVGSATGTSARSSSSSSSPPAAAGAAAASNVSSATPPGSVPTFTVAGCATSQQAVAQTLVRLRLIDGVKEVNLQSSTKTASGGGAGGAGCASGTAAWSATVVFQPMPETSAVASAASAKTVAATTGKVQ